MLLTVCCSEVFVEIPNNRMTEAKPFRETTLVHFGKCVFLDEEAGEVWKFFIPRTAARVN